MADTYITLNSRQMKLHDNGDGTYSFVLPVGTNNIGDVDVASIAAGETHIGKVSYTAFSTSGTFTRPAGTDAYAAGDVVCNSTSAPADIDITGVARVAGGGAWLNSIRMVSTNPAATPGSFRLHLYSAAVTPANDNAAFAPSDAVALTEVGSVDLDIAESSSNNVVYKTDDTPIFVKCAATALYAVIEARSAYTPASEEVFTLLIAGEQD